jgi:chromosome segregation protein
LQSNAQNLARLADQRAAGLRRLDELAQERAALDAQLHAHQVAHEGLLAQIDALRAEIDPAENEQAALETAQADLERREAELTSALLAAESAHGRAAVDVQRARDRIDTLWERAAADDIDIETAGDGETENQEPRTGEPENQEPEHQESRTEAQAAGRAEADGSTLETQSLATGTTFVAAAESLESNIQHLLSETQMLESSVLSTQSSESAESLESRIQQLKTRIQRLGVVNPLALEEYDEASERHTFLTSQTSDLRQAELALRELISELDSAMQARFEATFRAVAAEFEHSFTRLFGGGQAQLLLSRSNSSTNGEQNGESNGEMHAGVEDLGVEILARPPGKRQQTLSLLSGGERTLTAAALLFAILKVNPSPFCVLDEVDAALDEANVGRFREALTDLSQQTQFLLVTHNRGTIEAADTIYGVSMGEDGASRVLSLRLEELVED